MMEEHGIQPLGPLQPFCPGPNPCQPPSRQSLHEKGVVQDSVPTFSNLGTTVDALHFDDALLFSGAIIARSLLHRKVNLCRFIQLLLKREEVRHAAQQGGMFPAFTSGAFSTPLDAL